MLISQNVGSFGRVRFQPRSNNFGKEINKFIEENLTTNKNGNELSSKKADSRGARRITYETMNGKLKYYRRPERTIMLAKNLWKMQKPNHYILENTINHLISTFPELKNLIKENEDCNKSTINQSYTKTLNNIKSLQMKIKDETTDKIVETASEESNSKATKEKPVRNKRKNVEGLLLPKKRKSLKARKSSFSSTSSTSSKVSSHSEPRMAENEGNEYNYINNIKPCDLSHEDDQESIDQLEADLMDESLIELTNIL